jgi:hypothetical protein
MNSRDQEVYVETLRQWRRGWWGGHWEPPRPLSAVQLLRAGSCDARLLALAWLLIESHGSVLVAAEPPEAGKTTTLTALLEFLPREATRVYTRGFEETFDFVRHSAPATTWILCNEISPDLGVYTWGPAVAALFTCLEAGYAVATTMHADTLEAIAGVLTGYPLEVPARRVGYLTLVLTLRLRYEQGRVVRRVRVAYLLQPGGADVEGFEHTEIARYDENRDGLVHDSAPALAFVAARSGRAPAAVAAELERRTLFLEDLESRDVVEVGAVRAALDLYRQGRAWRD